MNGEGRVEDVIHPDDEPTREMWPERRLVQYERERRAVLVGAGISIVLTLIALVVVAGAVLSGCAPERRELVLCPTAGRVVAQAVAPIYGPDLAAVTFLGTTVYLKDSSHPCLQAHEGYHADRQLEEGALYYLAYASEYQGCVNRQVLGALLSRWRARPSPQDCYWWHSEEVAARKVEEACMLARGGTAMTADGFEGWATGVDEEQP